jgi:hypothetical protein
LQREAVSCGASKLARYPESVSTRVKKEEILFEEATLRTPDILTVLFELLEPKHTKLLPTDRAAGIDVLDIPK